MSKIKIQGDAGGTGIFTIASPNSSTNRTITLPDDTGTIVTSAQTSTAAYSFVVDEDNMASDLATKVPSQQSVKAYVDAQVGAENTLAEDNDVNITSAADGSMLLYDTGTSKWIDNVMSGHATLADTGVITIANDAVDSQHLAADSIDAEHYAAGSVDATAIGDDVVNSQHIAADSIDAEHLAPNSVNTDAIIDAAVRTAHIQADNITSALIADDQIDSEHIVDGSIDLAHMSVNSIDSDQYVDASIDTAHIGASQITNALMADDAVDSAEIADGAVDLAHMSVNSIDSDQYVDGSIDTIHIAASQITNNLMADDAIDSAEIADGAVDLAHMSANSVDSDQYVDGSVDNVHLANSSVTVSDGSNTSPIALGGTLTFAGTTNEIEVAESAGTITVGLPDNVTIAGNLTVSGTNTSVSSTTITVADSLLALATNNNSADAVDVGFYGLMDTTGSQDVYSGLFRDASDSGKWKIFGALQAEPTTTVNTAGTGYAMGTLVANIEGATVTTTGNIAVGGTVDGRDVAADGTKLDGIESSATADQTNTEIRDAVEAASDSNTFTDADHSNLNAIEASATADQTNADIRTAVEAASDSNVFTDADHTKLNAIEASATADQTAAQILTAIKTVDGAGSGLDADLLDGQSGAHYRVDIYNVAGSLLN